MFAHVSVWGIIVAALAAMVIGAIWYNKTALGKKWMKYIGLSDDGMKKMSSVALPMLMVVSLVTAYALSLVISYLHAYAGGSWMKAGIEASLLASIGFAVTAVFAHGAFDPRDRKVLLINGSNRVVTYGAMGLILAAFLK